MELDFRGNKGFRLLSIFERLNKGEYVRKHELAREFQITEKTVQRDIDELRAYFADTHMFEHEVDVRYDRTKNAYHLIRQEREWLTNQEVLAICKVLLESRAFNTEEMNSILSKLVLQVAEGDKKQLEELLIFEKHHYVPLRHGKALLEAIWELSDFVYHHEIIKISYARQDGMTREHRVKPVAIMFSEYYFYLVTFMADEKKDFPTIFRIDRIKQHTGSKEYFHVPYEERFSDGEFRKRVQFMYAGALRQVCFTYSGPSVEAVLDRFPTAEILEENAGAYRLRVEVYGDGIDLWLKGQGNHVTLD